MEIRAKSTISMSPRKVNLIANSIRNKRLAHAINELSLIYKRSAAPLLKTLQSALANAVNNNKLARENLWIKRIDVTQGVAFKRFRPSTRGRVHPYKKRSTHITVVLEEKK